MWLGALSFFFFFFQAEDGIRDVAVTGVQTCALPIFRQLVEEEHAEVGKRHLARMGWAAAADQARDGDRVVRGAERPPCHEFAVPREEPRDAPDRRDLEDLVTRERRKDRREASREHGLAATRRADQKQVVGAGRGDLERTFGVRLAANVAEVEVVGRGRLDGPRGRYRRCRVVAVQQADRVSEGPRSEHPESVHGDRLGGVLHGHDERADPLASAGETDRQRAADRLDLAVEREFANDGERSDGSLLHGAGGGENAEGDRQIERRAFLAKVGGREAHSSGGFAARGGRGVATPATNLSPAWFPQRRAPANSAKKLGISPIVQRRGSQGGASLLLRAENTALRRNAFQPGLAEEGQANRLESSGGKEDA